MKLQYSASKWLLRRNVTNPEFQEAKTQDARKGRNKERARKQTRKKTRSTAGARKRRGSKKNKKRGTIKKPGKLPGYTFPLKPVFT